ncbi:MAG: hypothetical protein CHACPFDD_03814 [Phycisphaerae bacterium]|nr:hypothetical protein [Phycisphaerae bacterium]
MHPTDFERCTQPTSRDAPSRLREMHPADFERRTQPSPDREGGVRSANADGLGGIQHKVRRYKPRTQVIVRSTIGTGGRTPPSRSGLGWVHRSTGARLGASFGRGSAGCIVRPGLGWVHRSTGARLGASFDRGSAGCIVRPGLGWVREARRSEPGALPPALRAGRLRWRACVFAGYSTPRLPDGRGSGAAGRKHSQSLH